MMTHFYVTTATKKKVYFWAQLYYGSWRFQAKIIKIKKSQTQYCYLQQKSERCRCLNPVSYFENTNSRDSFDIYWIKVVWSNRFVPNFSNQNCAGEILSYILESTRKNVRVELTKEGCPGEASVDFLSVLYCERLLIASFFKIGYHCIVSFSLEFLSQSPPHCFRCTYSFCSLIVHSFNTVECSKQPVHGIFKDLTPSLFWCCTMHVRVICMKVACHDKWS